MLVCCNILYRAYFRIGSIDFTVECDIHSVNRSILTAKEHIENDTITLQRGEINATKD